MEVVGKCPVGYTALVTGGTNGIGREVALRLAAWGARVVIVGRDEGRAAAVVAEGGPGVRFLRADLSEMAQVRAVAANVRTADPALHLLVHCAGVHGPGGTLTKEDIEYNFAANYLQKYLLTDLLMPGLQRAGGRVVVVGSPYVFDPRYFFRFRGLYQEPPTRWGFWALVQAGLAVSVWAVAQARQLAGTGVTLNVVVPGVVRTDILRDDPWLVRLLDRLLRPLVSLSVAQGAAGPLYLATASALADTSGAFFENLRHGPPKRLVVPTGTYDEALAQRLAAFSAEVVEIR